MRAFIRLIRLGLALGAALIAGSVQAQTEDHLKCYRIKGDIKLKGLVNIETAQFGLDPETVPVRAYVRWTVAAVSRRRRVVTA